jgi:serine/threonine protein kinase
MLDILQAQERCSTEASRELRSRLALNEAMVQQKDSEIAELRTMVRRLHRDSSVPDYLAGTAKAVIETTDEESIKVSTPRNGLSCSRSASCALFGEGAHLADEKRVFRQSSCSMLLNSPRQSLIFSGVVLPYVLPRGHTINDKYQVIWNEPVHMGMLSGLSSEGTNCLGTVFKAKVRANSGLRAVKVIRKDHVAFPKLFQQQVADLHNMEHASICRFQDVYEDSNCLYLVFDYCAGPSILEKALSDPQYCERDAAAAFKVLLQALAYLHEHHIVHQNVHLDGMRFMVSPPQSNKPRSIYGNQLKVLGFGLMMHLKHLSAVVQGLEPLPFLPVRSAEAHSNSACMAPEYAAYTNGLRSYAQLASGVEKSCCRSPRKQLSPRRTLGSSRSNPLEAPSPSASFRSSDRLTDGKSLEVPSPLKARTGTGGGGGSPSSSRATTRLRSQEPVSRQTREVFKLLQAGDMWSAGCILHILLTGGPPAEDVQMSWKASPLAAVSSSARDFCLALLSPEPEKRPSATEALQSEWFRQVQMVHNVHRSQNKGSAMGLQSALVTPMSGQVKARMAKYSSVCHLRRVVAMTSALLKDAEAGGNPLLPALLPADVPAHVQAEVPVAANLKVTVDFLAQEAFQCIMSGKRGTCLPLQDLLEIVEGASQGCNMPWKKPLGVLMQMTPILKAAGLTVNQFAEFIWAVCK